MQEHFKLYRVIDTTYAGKVFFRLQNNETVLSVKVSASTGDLVIETDKPLGLEKLQELLNVFPDLIIQQQEKN